MNYTYQVDHQLKSLDEILEIAKELVAKHGPYRVSVAAGEDIMGLGGLSLGRENGLIEPVLIGHNRRIQESFERLGKNPAGWTIIHEKDEIAATVMAANYVISGQAEILMRGKLLAYDFLKTLLSKELNIRKRGDLWTNIVVAKVDTLDRLLLITDPAVIIKAEIPKRLQHIRIAIDFANFLGIEHPKVALLAAVETVSPSMPVSMEEAIIAMMGERGQLPACAIVDGPLSLDLAVNAEAAKKKKIKSEVAGKADILVVNNLGIGNVLFKSLITLCGGSSASTVVGLPFPTVLTSRSESPKNIQYSLALSIMMAGAKK